MCFNQQTTSIHISRVDTVKYVGSRVSILHLSWMSPLKLLILVLHFLVLTYPRQGGKTLVTLTAEVHFLAEVLLHVLLQTTCRAQAFSTLWAFVDVDPWHVLMAFGGFYTGAAMELAGLYFSVQLELLPVFEGWPTLRTRILSFISVGQLMILQSVKSVKALAALLAVERSVLVHL